MVAAGSTSAIERRAQARAADPSLSEAWWWLGIPVTVAIAIVTTYQFAPDFYRERVLPEGYGILELSHFFMPLAGFLICARLFFHPCVRADGLLRLAVGVFAVTCLFIAGEEHSWGQWFFYWNTPEFLAELNRQQETNLHNISHWFNQTPQTVLQVAIVVGGIILPLLPKISATLARAIPVFGVLIPPPAIVPVAIIAMIFKQVDRMQKSEIVSGILVRPSEATETFFYMFILFYVVMLRRRILAMS